MAGWIDGWIGSEWTRRQVTNDAYDDVVVRPGIVGRELKLNGFISASEMKLYREMIQFVCVKDGIVLLRYGMRIVLFNVRHFV